MRLELVVLVRFVKKISDRGTLTVPRDVREALGLEDGDLVDVQIVRVVGRRPPSSLTSASSPLTPTPLETA